MLDLGFLGHFPGLDRGDLLHAPLVASAFELGAQEQLDEAAGPSLADAPSAEGKHVGVVVEAPELGVVVMAGVHCAHARELVRDDRHTGAGPAGDHRAVGFALGDESAGDLWLQNEAGVILHLKAKRTGLMLTLGGDAILITMKP